MVLPVNLQSASPDLRLEMIRMAVFNIMSMNNSLYSYLYSNTFDVPDYEKENILYNNKMISYELDEYMSGGYYREDFRFHQKQLDVQIIRNRMIRQNVRECREMYADRHNPWYSRKKYKTREIYPDAVQRNLPELLPMTHLCDHLLTVFHYMHDPQVALVMDYITGGGTRPSVTPGVQLQGSSATFPGNFNTQISISFINQETRAVAASVEICRSTATVSSARQLRALELPVYVVPVEIPRPVNLLQKSRYDAHKPVSLMETSRHEKPKTEEKLKPVKHVEKPKPVKPVEKPKMICETDLVGQILLQGLNTSKSQFPSLLPVVPVTSSGRTEKTLTKPATSTEVKKKSVPSKTSEVLTSKPTKPNSTMNPILSSNKVAWDMSKVISPRSSATAKRPSDVLADNVKDEMAAKRQRLSQWLYDHATQPDKKQSTGTKRKASLMEKSCKDHSVKKQKLATATPKFDHTKPTNKKDIKWIK